MLYLELLRTQIEEGYLKESLKETFKQKDMAAETLANFKGALNSFSAEISALVSSDQLPLEADFLLAKRRIFEYKAWIELFIKVILETHAQLYQSLKLEEQKNTTFDRLDELLQKLKPLESKILSARMERLGKNYTQEVAQALEKINHLLKESQKTPENPEQQAELTQLLHKQESTFKNLASLFNSQIQIWELGVIKHGRGFIFSDIKRIPFSAIYTAQGDIYIVLEIMGHLLGYGFGKVACRAVHLQTGTIFALIRSRVEYPEITEKKELDEMIEKNFLITWRESEILIRLRGKLGILQIRERMALEIKRGKELFLIEDYFPDGTLGKILSQLFENKKKPLTFEETFLIGYQLLMGLKSIHESGFIHCDIKPENILIDSQTCSKCIASIADFNTAQAYTEHLDFAHVGHSPLWCPPEYAAYHLIREQTPEPGPVGPLLLRWDVWSMGCVLYCLFFKEWLPWSKEEQPQCYKTISQLKSDWISFKHHENPYYPLIKKMLEPDPSHRATSSEAFSEFMAISQKIAPKG